MANQLRKFVENFRSELLAGNDAHLQLESHAGKVWINFQVCIVQPPPPTNLRKPGPSRLRRRARRAAARERAVAENAAPKMFPVLPKWLFKLTTQLMQLYKLLSLL